MSPEEEVQKFFLKSIALHWSMFAAIDTTCPGLVIPQFLKDAGSSCLLEYGLNMPVPINDLEVTAEGIRATLSFGREAHETFVPWRAVLAFRPRDMPGAELPKGAVKEPPPKGRRGLRAVGPEEIYSADKDTIEAALYARPTLRVVN